MGRRQAAKDAIVPVGQRVIVHFRPPEWEKADMAGTVETVVYESTIRLDKPYFPRWRKKAGLPAIEEMYDTFLSPEQIGTKSWARGHSRHPGRVVKVETQYVVLLDTPARTVECHSAIPSRGKS